MPPQLTVVMPAHNTEKYIGAAIQSILNQTYTNYELWVLENNSSDATAAIARSFDDPRIRVFELGKVGFQGALQYAIDHSESEFLARMDSDDVCLPTRLEKQMQVFATHPDCILVGSNYGWITPFDHFFDCNPYARAQAVRFDSLRGGTYLLDPKANRYFADAGAIFRREVAARAGGYDPEFTMGDVPLWLRMLRLGNGWEIPNVLYYARLRSDSLSRGHNEGRLVRAKYYGTFPQPPAPDRDVDPFLKFWTRVMRLEQLTGDTTALKLIARQFEQKGHITQAEAIRRELRLGVFGTYRARWRLRREYRYRPRLSAAFPFGTTATIGV